MDLLSNMLLVLSETQAPKFMIKNTKELAGEISAVKDAYCSCRGPWFTSVPRTHSGQLKISKLQQF